MDTTNKKPKNGYEALLFKYEDLTIETVEKTLPLIPIKIRDLLKLGPVPYRYDCGVCQAFGGRPNRPPGLSIFDDNMMLVWIYHELPKIRMKYDDQNFYGQCANEIYKRCIETYRAAGFTGTAPEPNA